MKGGMLWKGKDWSCEEDTGGQGQGGEEDIKSQSWGSKKC